MIENPTDAELVEAARGGDSFAITRLWQRHLAVAWCAARAASGRADAEPVVVRTAERLIAELGEGHGPVGATRPHLLALTRLAVADLAAAEPTAAGSSAQGDRAEGPRLELAPSETYRDLLPDGVGDGSAAASAYASLPTRWQESLWLAEVDGLSAAEIAAELGMTAEAVESTLADARAALRTEWSSMRLAELPDDAPCRAAAAASKDDRWARAHLDDCAGCRAVTAPPESVSRRGLAILPLLLLGAGGGIAFLESLRPGASAAATQPVPSVAEAAALASGAAALEAATTGHPIAAPAGRIAALPAALVTVVRDAPRRRVAAVGAALAGIAATTALVAALVGGAGGADDASRFLADSGSAGDVAEPPAHLLPPVVVATDVPDDPESSGPPAPTPDAEADATPRPDAAPAPDDGTDGTADPAPADPGPADPGGGDGAPRPGDGAPAAGSGQPIVAPLPPAEPARAPLTADLGRPGANGWRPLAVTGEPGADFTVSSGGDVLFTGVLDASGATVLQVRGTVGDVEELVLSYGSAGGTSYTLTAQPAPSDETARRGRSSAPTPTP
ncbi:MAG TPA: sigma factor-like helix-turn-helix DNA-binding protein [Agromyces sp.]